MMAVKLAQCVPFRVCGPHILYLIRINDNQCWLVAVNDQLWLTVVNDSFRIVYLLLDVFVMFVCKCSIAIK